MSGAAAAPPAASGQVFLSRVLQKILAEKEVSAFLICKRVAMIVRNTPMVCRDHNVNRLCRKMKCDCVMISGAFIFCICCQFS